MEQTEAVVLRVFPWSETSCVATIFTRDFGKLAVLAKGARRPKSPFEAALDLLSLCRVVLILKSADSLDLLTEAKLERRFRAASRDLLRLNCGYYVAELLDQLTDKGDRHPEAFELTRITLAELEDPDLEPRAIVLRFELQMLRLVGHLPSWGRCVFCDRDLAQLTQPDDEWVLFSPVSGGVTCSECQLGARQKTRFDRQVQSLLLRFSEPDWRQISVAEYPPGNRSTVRKVLTNYLRVLLDREFRLHAYLEELGR